MQPVFFNQCIRVFLFVSFFTFTGNVLAQSTSESTKLIKNTITNKIINTSETFINQQANAIANRFSRGKTAISIKGIESKKPNFSIDTIQPLNYLHPDTKVLTFIQGSVFSGENEGSSRNTLNFGIGQRFLIHNDQTIAGANLVYDREQSSKHKRLSFGLEYQRMNFSATTNYYHPLSDQKTIKGYNEQALKGYDIHLTGQVPYIPWADLKVTQSYWNQITGDNINASKVGLQIMLSPSTRFEFGQEDSNTTNKSTYGSLTIQLPFTQNEKLTRFTIDNKPFETSGKMSLASLKFIERSRQIKIEKLNIAPVFTSDLSASVAENQTSAITLVATDTHGVTYSISGTDSSLFSINSSTGVVVFSSAPDYENPGDSGGNNVYDFTATTTDANGLTTTQSVSIAVTDVSETFASGDSFNGVVYLTVTSPDTSKVWLDRNLGASQACTSSTDSDCYGKLYQWGRNDDGHESRTSSTTTTLASDITPGTNTFITDSADWTSTDSSGSSRTSAWTDGGANDICPIGYSVPTEAELVADTTSATTTDIINSATAYSSFLKMPVGGYRADSDGALTNVGSTGYYWSRTYGSYSRQLVITGNGVGTGIGNANSTYGFSVRCIKD
jgi:uncharacterized protein (TIGR02145 family)